MYSANKGQSLLLSKLQSPPRVTAFRAFLMFRAYLSWCLVVLSLAVLGLLSGSRAEAHPGDSVEDNPGTSAHTQHRRPRQMETATMEAPEGSTAKLDRWLIRATRMAEAGKLALARDLFRQVESSSPPGWHRWAALSGQVWAGRLAGSSDVALEVTHRIASESPDLAGLMAIWDGDTFWNSGELDQALQSYELASAIYGNDTVDGVPLGVSALRLLSLLELERGSPANAASAERELLARYPTYIDREASLARALLFEAAAAGAIAAQQLRSFLNPEEFRTMPEIVLKEGSLVEASLLAQKAMQLRGVRGVRFVLSESDQRLLTLTSQARAVRGRATTACTPANASDGFQTSITHDPGNFGFRFMTSPDCCSGWHPGVDLNAPNDCSLNFKSVARGCVRDTTSSASDYGTVSVEHTYLPDRWVSAYLHGDYPPLVSVGQAVTKGMSLGNVDDVGTSSCHLHLEIRETDHEVIFDARNYSNKPQSRVGDWYQDPLPFIAAHRSYAWVRWVDESAFTRSGTWNYVAGLGDRDDMMWAATTSSLTNRASYEFTTQDSGTYELWAFVPWQNSTSRKVPYKVVKNSTGTTLLSVAVDQYPLYDAWVRLGTIALSANTKYRLEIATNTAEASKRVSVDDFLIIRRP